MRIKNLKFRGVGSFKDEFEIDFDALGGAALYLIDGPTGAGKTTILDCIVFALYGDTSVSGTDTSRIRSDFAGPQDETYVELTFANSTDTYWIRRTPRYSREKLRGEGTTPVTETASLFKLDHRGEKITPAIETKVADTNKAIERYVGLNKKQFAQTMVLPQGQFAEFLRSDTSVRRPLLRSVFGVAIYEQVIVKLQERAKAARKADDEAKLSISNLLTGLNEHIHFEESEIAALSSLIELRADEDLAQEVAAAIAELSASVEAAKTALAAATAQKLAAEQLHKDRKRESDAEVELAAADTAVVSAVELEQTALESLSDDARLCAKLELDPQLGLTDSVWSGAKSKLDELVGELNTIQALETAAGKWPKQLRELDAAVAAAEAAEQKLVAELAAIPEQLAAFADVDEKLTAATRALTDIEIAGERLAEQQRLHSRLAELDQQLATKQQAAEKVVQSADQAEALRIRLTGSRIAGMAAELASKLEEGIPCSVCGSTSHPTKAKAAADRVTEEQVVAAEADATAKRQQAEAATKAFNEVQTQIVELNLQLTVTTDELPQKLSSHQTEVARLKKVESDVRDQVTQRNRLDERQKSLLEQKPGLTGDLTAAETTRSEQLKQHEAALQQIAQALDGYPTVGDRLQDVREFGKRLAGMAAAARNRAAAVERQATAKSAYDALPKHPDFARAVEAELELVQARERETQLFADHRVLAARLNGAKSNGETLVAEARQRTLAYQQNKILLEVEDLFTKNQDGLSLETFVLQEMFEQVVAAANDRFESLLEGRFRLVTTDEGKGGGQKGLGLNVLDLSLNEERIANTLSGGETFCASLALALGLADVVQSEHGGIAIETLFIDEGFGSLDMDRLNDVMNMLQGLKQQGRTVGVISHVEEMKNQIGESIKVLPGGKGKPSSLEVTWMQ